MIKRLNIVFIGGTLRAVNLLRHIKENRHDINVACGIFMPGYEDEIKYCNELVKLAHRYNMKYMVTDKVNSQTMKPLLDMEYDAIIGGGIWRSMLPDEFINSAKFGYLGLHGSGVPKYRGWAGLNWYIINGEKNYILRMLKLDSGVDSGPLIADGNGNFLESTISLENELHVDEILKQLYDIHIKAYDKLLDVLVNNEIRYIPQIESDATYTCHRGPDDGEVDWKQNTKDIFNFIRAQSKPYPGAFTYYKGEKIYLWRVRPRHDYSNYIGRICGKVVTRNIEDKTVVILTKDSGIEVVSATCESSDESNPCKLFGSVRHRCMNKVENYCDYVGNLRNN